MDDIALERFTRLPAFDRLSVREAQVEEFFDLARFQQFLDKVGNPEKGLPVIHVAGSKGKGSTSALIASGLQSLGKKVGVFMSPYLNHPTESIFVNGEPMPDEWFAQTMAHYESVISKLGVFVSRFEVLTAMALTYFHESDVDFAVMETGLGGRLDATNIVESPILSVLCPVEKEHTEILGNSLTSIAYEKLGIVREETPLVVAHQDHFILEFARSVCIQKHAPFMPVTGKYQASVLSRSREGYSFMLKTPTREVKRIFLALLGDHQINNAITAWAALDQLMPDFEMAPVLDVWSGLTLPARFQLSSEDGHDVVRDAAHTVESAKALRRTLDQIYPNQSVTFVLALLDDKDVEGFVRNLIRWGDAIVITQVNHPRSLPARVVEERLTSVMPAHQITSVITNNVGIAWQKALKLNRRNPICVTGSFRLMEVV